MTIKFIKNAEDIARCYSAFLELRPHLPSEQAFVDHVLVQQQQGYQVYGIEEEGEIVACIGLRFFTMLAWGKVLYIDDLITKASTRGKGYGNKLMKYAINLAREVGCQQVHLDTGYTRHAAHRVYLNNGFELLCHHLALRLT